MYKISMVWSIRRLKLFPVILPLKKLPMSISLKI